MTKEERAILEAVVNQLLDLIKKQNPLSSDTDIVDIEVTVNKPDKPEPMTANTLDDLRMKAQEAMRYTTVDDVKALFAGYGVAHVSDLKVEQYDNAYEALEDMIKNSTKAETDASDD